MNDKLSMSNQNVRRSKNKVNYWRGEKILSPPNFYIGESPPSLVLPLSTPMVWIYKDECYAFIEDRFPIIQRSHLVTGHSGHFEVYNTIACS